MVRYLCHFIRYKQMTPSALQQLVKMGSHILHGYIVNDPNTMPLGQLDIVEDLCFRKIWKNKVTQTMYEQYSVFDTSQTTPQQELDIYEKRRVQEFNLVKVFYVQNVNKEYVGSCCRELKVFTQHIPILISDIQSMPLNSALYFLKKALTGYQLLFRQIGFFEITPDMMGLNCQNQPKVWLNSNWAINRPLDKNALSTSNSIHLQGIMVRKLFEEIERVVKVEELIKYLLEKHKIQQWTFELAYAFISYFLQAERIILPCKISFIKKYSRNEPLVQEEQRRKISPTKQESKHFRTSLSIQIPETNTESINTPTNKKIFPGLIKKPSLQQSIHYRYQTPVVLNFKPKNSEIFPRQSRFNQKHTAKLSLISQQIKGIQPTSPASLSASGKKVSPRRQYSQSHGFDFYLKKPNKIGYSNQKSPKTFLTDSKINKTNSFIDPETKMINITLKSQKGVRTNLSASQRRLKTQSTILKPQFAQFKKIKPRVTGRTSEAPSSSAGLEKSKTSEADYIVTENTIKASTIDSNGNTTINGNGGYYSPMVQPLNRQNFTDFSKNWLVLSQEVKAPKNIFEEGSNKSPMTGTGSPYLKANDIKQSEIIAEDIEQVVDLIERPEESFLSKQKMSESITINEFMDQPKRNDKPLLMLDMLVSKKAFEKVMDEQITERYPNQQPKNSLVLSIIETAVQEPRSA